MKDKIEHEIYYYNFFLKKIFYEEYLKNEKLHREDGPAYVIYFTNGNKLHERYYINGNLHRLDGPAKIYYYDNGTIESEEYWLNGTEYEDIFKWLVAVGAEEKI